MSRPPPTPIFATPQREQKTPVSQQKLGPTQTIDTASPAPVTPKVGGKWTHPALLGIDKEARKFMFGEEELKRLVLNSVLLYSMWWITAKLDERYIPSFMTDCSDMFEHVVRYVKHSPRIALSLQIISWALRGLFLFNILRSLLPLLRPKSRPLTTIPLTPAQRELIGLDKTGTPSKKSY